MNPLAANSFSYFYIAKYRQFQVFHDLKIGYLYTKHYRIDLLTLEKTLYPIEKVHDRLKKIGLKKNPLEATVFHFSYEWGHTFFDRLSWLKPNQPYVIELVYKQSSWQQPVKFNQPVKLSIVSKPSFENYQQKFRKIYQELINGNSYQVNLTEIFKLNLKERVSFTDIAFKKQKNMSAYTHGTYLPQIDWGLLSLSPECLFKVKKKKNYAVVRSMPIKGTLRVQKGERISTLWKQLKSDPKEQAELNMITDLIRNDLSAIDLPLSEVVHEKKKLVLNNLLHQYSDVRCPISLDKNVYDIIKSLFLEGVLLAPLKETP